MKFCELNVFINVRLSLQRIADQFDKVDDSFVKRNIAELFSYDDIETESIVPWFLWVRTPVVALA